MIRHTEHADTTNTTLWDSHLVLQFFFGGHNGMYVRVVDQIVLDAVLVTQSFGDFLNIFGETVKGSAQVDDMFDTTLDVGNFFFWVFYFTEWTLITSFDAFFTDRMGATLGNMDVACVSVLFHADDARIGDAGSFGVIGHDRVRMGSGG